MSIVVGDIGATNARFAVAEPTAAGLVLEARTTLPSRRFSSFDEAVETFLDGNPEARRCRRATFGVAGLVRDNRGKISNLSWGEIDGSALARRLALDSAHLLNDVEAAAWGLTDLDPDCVRTLREGSPDRHGNLALLAPGTGLGEAALFWDGRRHVPVASEGGNTDFAAADDLQVALWRFLAQRYGHVSWERVVSGPGLVTLFRFLLAHHEEDEPAWLSSEVEGGDPAAAISRRAREGACHRCREALGLFFTLLGAEAGNLALEFLATGGVYLAGGILPKVLPELAESRFFDSFEAKGSYRTLLEKIPVRVVMSDDLGLRGAAACAAWDGP